MHNIKRNKAEENGEPGGGGSEKSESEKAAEQTGPKLDDLGYEVPEPEGTGKEEPEGKKAEEKGPTGYEDKPDEKKEPEPEFIKDPATGYDEDKAPKAPEEKPEPKAEADDKDKPQEIEFSSEGLDEEDITEIKEFAKKHSVTNEVAQALADQRLADIKEYKQINSDQEAENERNKQAQRVAWHQELKADKDFGGEHFGHNIKQAEKVIDEFMPGLKKQLTDSGAMLPPYVMRDLAKMATHLYSTAALDQGGAPGLSDAEKEAEADDPLAYYNT